MMNKQLAIFMSLALTFLTGTEIFAQEGSIGIGTETPNKHAVLEISSPGNNQGLLIPRVTTAQRNATSFVDSLSSTENGLLVFDSDLNTFYFWSTDQWTAVGNTQFTAGSGINIVDGIIENTGDGDSDALNEIQDLVFSGNELSITNNASATSIDLSALIDDADADTLNEIQDLQITGSNTLTITGHANPTAIDLSPFMGTNTDNQTLTYDNSSGYTISISNGNSIDVSDLKDDADADPTNELELPATASDGDVLSYSGGDWIATANNINDADSDPTNEIELPSSASEGDVLTYSGGAWVAGTDAVNDGDTDDTNELEFPSTASDGDIMKYASGSWEIGVDEVDDADASTTNEIQDLSYNSSTNVLSISGGGTSVDLSELDDTFSSPWDESSGMVSYNGDYAQANNFVSPANPEAIKISSGGNIISRDQVKFSKIVQIDGADAANVLGIERGLDGQQIICIVINAQAIFVNENASANDGQLILSQTSHTLTEGSTIHLVYNETLSGWVEISFSLAQRGQ